MIGMTPTLLFRWRLVFLCWSYSLFTVFLDIFLVLSIADFVVQSGRDVMMVSSLMSSSKTVLISHFLSLHLLLKGEHHYKYLFMWLMAARWIFYSAVNSIVPQISLNLGFENSSWRISIRQLAYNITILVFSIPITCVSSPFRAYLY